MSHVTRTVRPSLEIWSRFAGRSGDLTFLIAGLPLTAPMTSRTVARNSGSPTVREELWISTSSVCRSAWGKPCFRIWSALCDWPVFVSSCLMFFVPTCCPIIRATTTNASQPKTAVFQWPALQRPIRAAMLLERLRGDIVIRSFVCVARCGSEPRSGESGRHGADRRLRVRFVGRGAGGDRTRKGRRPPGGGGLHGREE